MKRIILTLTMVVWVACFALAQKNPVPFALSNGNFEFTGFEDASSSKYPFGMTGWAGAVPIQEPGNPAPEDYQAKGDAALHPSSDDYLLATIKNEADSGISIRGEALDETAVAIVLALNTVQAAGITLEYEIRTIHSFVYSISEVHLQYRIGVSGNWTNVDGHIYDIGVYGAETLPAQTLTWDLPAELEEQEVVQVRWLVVGAGQTSPTSGRGSTGRAHIRSITVTTTDATPQAPKSDFSVSKRTPDIGEPITFSDLSSGAPDEYFWDFGDGNTSTETNPFHAYDTNGFYTVTLITTNAAGSDTLVREKYMAVGDTTEVSTAIQTSILQPLQVYPNLTSGVLNISNVEAFADGVLLIRNLTGETVMTKQVAPQVWVNHLANGLYFIEVHHSGKLFRNKFIKN